MTKEEAIKRMKSMRWEHATNPCPDRTAFDMAISALSDNNTEKLLNEFVDFLIKETCQGCKMCTPGIDDKGVVCLHQGEAVWCRDMIERFKEVKLNGQKT